MNIKRILVTGSEGIVGKILTNNLHGYFLLKVDKLPITKCSYFDIDLSDNSSLNQLKDNLPIDCVVHLAADSNPKADWHSVLRNNIIATKNIYDFCIENNVPKIVFASSNHVTGLYEEEIEFPYTGSHNLIDIEKSVKPDGFYAVSKLFGENMGRCYSYQFKLKVVCIRIGSVLIDNNPSGNPRFLSTWLSHNDLVQLIKLSIESSIEFGIYYGVSNNTNRFWNINNAIEELGYIPKDNATFCDSYYHY